MSCAGGGGPSGGPGGDADLDRLQRDLGRDFGPDAQRALDEALRWLGQNLGLIVAAAAIIALLALVLLVISFLCQGALARATVDLALGRPATLGMALGAGRRLFWRYVGLGLILFGLGLAVLLVLALVGALFWFGWWGSGGALGPLLAVLGLFGGLAFVLVVIPIAIILGVVVAFAQRAIAAEDVGPLAALRAGWRLLWANKGSSALAWFMSLVMSIAAAFAIGFALVVLLLPLGIVGAILFATGGVTPASIGFVVVAGLILLLALVVLGSAANAYIWTFWTLVYLHLLGRLGSKMEPLPVPA